jgi:hypothetical protein
MPQETIISVPATSNSKPILRAVDAAAKALRLLVTLRAELKSFPGSTHWHLKQGRHPGTLEITWWPKERKLWIKVQAGRTATWIDELAPRLKRKIEAHLRLPRRLEKSTKKRTVVSD